MEMTKLKITPVMAKEWLDSANDRNRSLSIRNVKKFASDMENGNWRNTHQNAIAFYNDGTLADGQHRLAAIVESGVALEMFVASGLCREDGGMIDQGRPRSVVDAMKIGGLLSSDKYATYAAAIVKLVFVAEKGKVNRNLSIYEVAEAIEKMREGIDFSCGHLTSIQGVGLKNATMRGAVAVAYYHVDHDRLAQFCRVMVTGMPEDRNDAMLVRLRNHILLKGDVGGGTERVERYKMILKAIANYANNVDVRSFRKTSENAFEVGIFNG